MTQKMTTIMGHFDDDDSYDDYDDGNVNANNDTNTTMMNVIKDNDDARPG